MDLVIYLHSHTVPWDAGCTDNNWRRPINTGTNLCEQTVMLYRGTSNSKFL